MAPSEMKIPVLPVAFVVMAIEHAGNEVVVVLAVIAVVSPTMAHPLPRRTSAVAYVGARYEL